MSDDEPEPPIYALQFAEAFFADLRDGWEHFRLSHVRSLRDGECCGVRQGYPVRTSWAVAGLGAKMVMAGVSTEALARARWRILVGGCGAR